MPPLQPMFQESQETMSCGESTTSTSPWEAMQKLSERASVAAKAQQDPQCC